MSKYILRIHLLLLCSLDHTRVVFGRVPDSINNRGFTLMDCLMSGLAVFHLKYPSFLDGEAKLLMLAWSTPPQVHAQWNFHRNDALNVKLTA